MLKILVYANMEGIYSSRKIMSACTRDINFIWLLNGTPAPSHHEIARFRSIRLAECGVELFYQIVEKLHKLGEIKYEHLFVDGTKIEANANKYSLVWRKSTTKYKERLLKKLERRTAELCSSYGIFPCSAEDVLSALGAVAKRIRNAQPQSQPNRAQKDQKPPRNRQKRVQETKVWQNQPNVNCTLLFFSGIKR